MTIFEPETWIKQLILSVLSELENQTAGFLVAFESTRCRLRSAGRLVPFEPQAFKALFFQYISYCKTRLPLALSKASSILELVVFIQ